MDVIELKRPFAAQSLRRGPRWDGVGRRSRSPSGEAGIPTAAPSSWGIPRLHGRSPDGEVPLRVAARNRATGGRASSPRRGWRRNLAHKYHLVEKELAAFAEASLKVACSPGERLLQGRNLSRDGQKGKKEESISTRRTGHNEVPWLAPGRWGGHASSRAGRRRRPWS